MLLVGSWYDTDLTFYKMLAVKILILYFLWFILIMSMFSYTVFSNILYVYDTERPFSSKSG